MSAPGWKALATCADLAMVIAIVASIRAGSALAGWLSVITLICVSAYSGYRADRADREGLRRNDDDRR